MIRYLILAALFSFCQNSHSEPIFFSGSFSATDDSDVDNPESVSSVQSIAGSWSFFVDQALFVYDSSIVIDNISLTSFSLSSGSFGSTLFDITNVFARIRWGPDRITEIMIGGSPDGVASLADDGRDDFRVKHSGFTSKFDRVDIAWIVGGDNAVGGATTGNPDGGVPPRGLASSNFSIKTVPEPGTLGLVGIGLAVIGVCKRRKPSSQRNRFAIVLG